MNEPKYDVFLSYALSGEDVAKHFHAWIERVLGLYIFMNTKSIPLGLGCSHMFASSRSKHQLSRKCWKN